MNKLNKAIADIPLPERLKHRLISAKGYPVPWFVTLKDADGEWDFRALDVNQAAKAHRGNRCWICGQILGVFKVFSIGPMCVVNRVSSEPPGHLECERYAVRACPFMAHPRMRRNSIGMVDPKEWTTPGIMLDRNPGVTCLWTTKDYKIEQPDRDKGILFRIGEPCEVEWWTEGRAATYTEVMQSVDGGLPYLREVAKQDRAERQLDQMIRKAEPIFQTAAV